MQILIVGDGTFAADRLAPSLRKGGCGVCGIVASGEEALERVSQTRPDLVVMDVQLQGEMDGIETAERMHKDFDLPVIFLSARGDAETLDRAKIAEPFGYLKKPFRIADLVGAIKIGVHKHSVARKSRERETWLTVALDCAGDGVMVTDAAGRIRFLNRLAKQILGLSDADVTGRGWSDIVHLQRKTTGTPAGDLIQLAILQGATMDAGEDLMVVRPSGEKRDVEGEIALCPVDGAIGGTVFTFRDVTLRNRRREEARQELRNQANAQLAGAISNQVGALLQAALRYGDEALAAIEADHAARGPVEAMRTQVEDLFGIARQLFTLKNNAVSFPSVQDLNAIVSEACATLRQDLPAEIALVTDLSPDLGEIRADAVEIRRAITLLAIRAGKGMPKGGEIRIKTRNYAFESRGREGEVEHYVIATISDTGPGMPPEDARRLFDPFSQSDGSGGSDLGLFVVQGIIADARGSISGAANPGEGTTFEILLPQAAVSRDSMSASESWECLQGHEAALLLVEADAGIRNLVADRLESEGFELLGACNSGEAISWVEIFEGPIAMLITNLAMADMSGPELAQRILLRYPALTTVFISDRAVDPSLEKTWLSQGASFLVKPFRQDELVRLVRATLGMAEHGNARSLAGLTVD